MVRTLPVATVEGKGTSYDIKARVRPSYMSGFYAIRSNRGAVAGGGDALLPQQPRL